MDLSYYDGNTKPEKGDLLISEPFLNDPNFQRTVVLLCEHGEDGTFGFVLNKPSILKGGDVLEGTLNFDPMLYIGGPVQQDTLHFIHHSLDTVEGGVSLGNGLRWGGNFEQLLQLYQEKAVPENRCRFFLGYSGWSAGQLEEELASHNWIICKRASPRDVFETEADELWRRSLQKMGGKFKVISNYPTDPRLN
jgi:putative transcriptional regulator